VASDFGVSAFGESGFSTSKSHASRIRNPRNPEVTWRVGPRSPVEYRWKHIGDSKDQRLTYFNVVMFETPMDGRDSFGGSPSLS
jgi:hypothetical protein